MANFKKKWELTSNLQTTPVSNPEDFKAEFSTTQSSNGFDISYKAIESTRVLNLAKSNDTSATVSVSPLTNQANKEISTILSKKNQLISKSELDSLGKNIKLVGYNPLSNLITDKNKTASPRLLNYVEPYEIGGYTKTLFWTSVNTGFKVGDRVFILNGNYDSNDLIQADKYKAGRDGYKVLFVDKCRVVLDLDYTGVNPYNDDDVDKFYQLYYIKNSNDFLAANRQRTTKGSSLDYKFNPGNNVLAYVDANYGAITGWGRTSGLSNSPGFFIKNGISASWTKLTSFLTTGSIGAALNSSLTSNSRLLVIGGDFTISGQSFKDGFVYKWVSANPSKGIIAGWYVDTTYMQPIITKLNFRRGVFNGEFNSGVFGQQSTQITWTGDKSTWNLGTLLNTTWTKGTFKSLYSFTQSYFASFDNLGLPYQKVNSPNNADRGFNFIFDSDITDIELDNSSVYRTTFGVASTAFSAVEDEILAVDSPFTKKINKGYFNNCYFNNTLVKKAELKNSRTENSKFELVKSINSYFRNSVFKNSLYNGDNIIKILAYDELTASDLPDTTAFSSVNDVIQKVYKFYINKSSWERLKSGDSFYLRGLKFNNSIKNSILNFFDKKFTVGSWTEYNEEFSGSKNLGKRGYNCSAFLSTPSDNSNLFTSVKNPSNKHYTKYLTNSTNINSNLYSIDIWVSRYDTSSPTAKTNEILAYNKLLSSTSDQGTINDNRSLGNIIDISDAYVVDSDFESGLFINSNWISGNHIERNCDSNLTGVQVGGVLNISTPTSNILRISPSFQSTNPEMNLIPKGNVIFLDSVDNINGTTVTRLPNDWKIFKSTALTGYAEYDLNEINTSVLGSISGGTYKTDGLTNRYNHFKAVKFYKSRILSGIFRRSFFKESFIQDSSYDSTDKDLTNIENKRRLLIVDSIFSDNSNFLSKSTYNYSFFKGGSDILYDGIYMNSLFTGVTFSNGVIRNSRWEDGVFRSGTFYNSNTFNAVATPTKVNSTSENIFSWWKTGISSLNNNRYSWQKGKFLSGSFLKSDWEDGQFLSGKFENSKWYNGTFSNGSIGNISLATTDTKFYNGLIETATVENASLDASDTSLQQSTKQTIIWQDGLFKNGEIKTNIYQSIGNEFTWMNGTFLNGVFDSNAVWEDGTFKDGKFISGFGWTNSISWTQSSSTFSDYGWRNGTFENGEFGNANSFTNSTWYTGQFLGGKFQGRIWNYGLFSGGNFFGSGFLPIGGLTCGSASQFVDSFSNSYYGHWKDGYVTNVKDTFDSSKQYFTELRSNSRRVSRNINRPSTTINNALWQSGTFSHPEGNFFKSVWLDGTFTKGRFINSVFNPYAIREDNVKRFNLNDETCVWNSGSLEDSDFYISRFKNGVSTRNNMYGAIWENGVNNYMSAYNVFWEDGTWRNGNWYGSYFTTTDGNITDDFVRQILFRGMSWSGTASLHIWNVFEYVTGVNQTSVSSDIVSGVSAESFSLPSAAINNNVNNFLPGGL